MHLNDDEEHHRPVVKYVEFVIAFHLPVCHSQFIPFIFACNFRRLVQPNPAYTFLNTIQYSFSDDVTSGEVALCTDHDHELLKPQVISTWMPNGVGSLPGKRVIFAETQVSVITPIKIEFRYSPRSEGNV